MRKHLNLTQAEITISEVVRKIYEEDWSYILVDGVQFMLDTTPQDVDYVRVDFTVEQNGAEFNYTGKLEFCDEVEAFYLKAKATDKCSKTLLDDSYILTIMEHGIVTANTL